MSTIYQLREDVQVAFEAAAKGRHLSTEWRAVEGSADTELALHARYADLVVVGQANAAQPTPMPGDLPEAVFCANDQMAIGFLRAMREQDLRAPDDIAIIGFDDILIARYMQPSLSTVGASRFLWGSRAASQLIAFLDHGSPFETSRIPTQLIQRESSTRPNAGPAPAKRTERNTLRSPRGHRQPVAK